MITPPVPTISTPHRSRLRLWLVLGGIIASIAICTWIVRFYRLAHRFEKEYAPIAATLPAELAAAKKEGLPITPEELRTNPPVSNVDNAAPLYRKLTDIYKKKSEEEAEKAFLTSYLKPKIRTSKDDKEIHSFLASHEAELTLMEKAAQKPVCDFERDWHKGFDAPFPEPSVMRAGARLLMLRAVMKSDENQPVSALQDITRAAKIAQHSASDPTLKSAVVKIAIQSFAHQQFVEILTRYGNDSAVLPAAKEAAAALSDPINMRHAFMGELVLNIVTMNTLCKAPDFAEQVHNQGIRIPVSNPQIQIQMTDSWQSRIVAYWRRVQASLIASKGDLRAFEKAQQRIQEEENANRLAPGYEVNAILLPVLPTFAARVMQNQATAHLRMNMILLLEYKHKFRKFPDSLDKLPDNPIKIDPFTNQPLKYKKTEKGFVLYSVSYNRVDDSGSRKNVKWDDANWTEDIVLSYP